MNKGVDGNFQVLRETDIDPSVTIRREDLGPTKPPEGLNAFLNEEILSLEKENISLTKKIYSRLDTWQIVQVARHPNRPHTSDFIARIFDDFDELHGDRQFGDDASIIGGIGMLENMPVMAIGHEKGRDTDEKVKRNFGMTNPEGYRKAKRLMLWQNNLDYL